MTPTKTPTHRLDPIEDVDLVVAYVVQWIIDAEDQIRGPSQEVGATRLKAVAAQVQRWVKLPWLYRRFIATLIARYVYGTIAQDLPPMTRSRGQVKI